MVGVGGLDVGVGTGVRVGSTGLGVGVFVAGSGVALGKTGVGTAGTMHPFRNTSEATIAMQRY